MREQEKILELINKSIDGTASAREERVLREQIDRDPEVRHLYDEFVKVSTALRSVKRVEPPSNLRHRIMNAVSLAAEPRSVPGIYGFEWSGLRRLFAKHRVAYALVAGAVAVGMLVVAFVLGLAFRGDSLEVSQMYGTMAERALLDRAKPVDKANFSLPGLTGAIRLDRDGDLLLADLATNAQTSSELRLSFDPNMLEVAGFRQLDGSVSPMSSTTGTITLTLGGQDRSVVVFTNKSSGEIAVRVTVLQANRTVFEQTLTAGKN